MHTKIFIKILIALLLGIFIPIANMAHLIPSLSSGGYYQNCALAIITGIVIITCGNHILINAWRALLAHTVNKDTLIAISVLIAYAYPCYVLIYMSDSTIAEIDTYFMHALIIISLTNFIIFLESHARMRINYNLQELYKTKQEILQFTDAAANSKSTLNKIDNRIVIIFIVCILIITCLTALIWLGTNIDHKLTYTIAIIISMLVAASPQALSLSLPIANAFGITLAAESGILIRNSDVLYNISKIKTLVLEKSNVISNGQMKLASIYPMPGIDVKTILSFAASAESASEHHISQAITSAAMAQKVEILPSSNTNIISGLGISATVGEHNIALGSAAFMQAQLIATNELAYQALQCAGNGKTTVFIAKDKQLIGLLVIDDPIKTGVANIVNDLQTMGIKVIMISGDINLTATTIAKKVGIQDVIAGVMREEKIMQINKLQEEEEIVAMVSYDINDTDTIRAANINFVISNSDNISTINAEVILLNNSLSNVIEAIKIARMRAQKIHNNLLCATIYNIIAISVATGVFFPIIGYILNPSLAVIFATLCTTAIIFNSTQIDK